MSTEPRGGEGHEITDVPGRTDEWRKWEGRETTEVWERNDGREMTE